VDGMTDGTVLDGVHDLASLVEYQDGAVVSRVVLKGGGGTATAFAFDAGQELSEHTVPHDALVLVVEGKAEITVSGAVHAVPAGAVLRMPGGEPHAVRAPGRFKMLLVLLRE
jgi:quercetin dioxygenase-like cupin family protein